MTYVLLIVAFCAGFAASEIFRKLKEMFFSTNWMP